jgi:gliding motility-associated-like protein
MKKEQNIEQLFKDAFEEFEAPVDASLWNGIEQKLNTVPAPQVPTDGSTLMQSLSSIKIAMMATVAAVLGIAVYMLTPSDKPVSKPSAIDIEHTSTSEVVQQNENKPTTFVGSKLPVLKQKEKGKEEKMVMEEKNTAVEIHQKTDADVSHADTQTEAPKLDENRAKPDAGKEQLAITENITDAGNANPKNNTFARDEKKSNEADVASIPGVENTVITPNGDGKNDRFEFDDSHFKTVYVQVYNPRTNKIVAEWNEPGGSWDGTTKNGQKAESGIYVVMIQASDSDGKKYKNTIKLQLISN